MKSAPPLALSDRVRALHVDILASPPALCAERALLLTRHAKAGGRRGPAVRATASALSYVLGHKAVRIYPHELLVGCFTSQRVGGSIYPELHGLAQMEGLSRLPRRRVNPLVVPPEHRRWLLREVLPHWAFRFLALRAFPPLRALRFIADQLSPKRYLVNEAGGISHLVPDYTSLVARGTEGFRCEAERRLAELPPESEAADFLRAIVEVSHGIEAFAEGYGREAARLSAGEADPARRLELDAIARMCARVPRLPAETFHEALQSILFAQIAINLESLDNAVSPGRLDQILQPFYERDLAAGRLDEARALELLGCFALKLCEIVPVFSERITRFHGGMFNGQVVVVGGADREGRDATNQVSHLLLHLMDELRTRQPNYHARLHAGSPPPYRRRIASALSAGAVSPAVYNDEVIVPMLHAQGMSEQDARDYATVGCVEPVAAGRSFLSTDAALANVPLCLELALNGGRRFGSFRRLGPRTPSASSCGSIEELLALFDRQLKALVDRLMADLFAIERANARLHPTPLTSMLLSGCLESCRDATAGGARYNGGGIQGVGVVEVGDALAAIEHVVFRKRQASMGEVLAACRENFASHEALRARLLRAPKYGNDDPLPDGLIGRVMALFASHLERHICTRGGRYRAGFYSVTAHQAFGEVVGALPSGRLAGQPFSSGLSPGSGRDRLGPTAALRSVAALPLQRAGNGVNFNLKLAPFVGGGETWVQGLIDGGFRAGAMQMQVNVLDPGCLIEARDHPGRYPGLLVRVSGYSAYFDDLSPSMKQEIIDRTLHEAR